MKGSCSQETSICLSRVGLHPFHLPYLKPTRFSETSPGSGYRYEGANLPIFSACQNGHLWGLPKTKTKIWDIFIYPYVILFNFYHFQNDVHSWHAPISSQHLTFQSAPNLQGPSIACSCGAFLCATSTWPRSPRYPRSTKNSSAPTRDTENKNKEGNCESLCYTCM